MMETNPTLWQASASCFATVTRSSALLSVDHFEKSMIGMLTSVAAVGPSSFPMEPMIFGMVVRVKTWWYAA